MTVRKDTLFEQFFTPVRGWLVDEQAIRQQRDRIDWQAECDRIQQPDLQYPHYYHSQNFHGIEGGYLSPTAAVYYDPITQYALPPNETLVRQGLIDLIVGQPRRILDLGCGTGTTTLMLKRAFPAAEVIGLDLSPYMLVVAGEKARNAGLEIRWQHGQAEATPFSNTSFDLVTISLLFHETPPTIAQAILQESHRLLTVGGEIVILDGNQQTLRQLTWLQEIFEEPYIGEYAAESVAAWLGAAGFGAVQAQDWWWLHQLIHGTKPLISPDTSRQAVAGQTAPETNAAVDGMPAPAFSSPA